MSTGLPSGTITFLLTDIEGSTGRWDDDPDAMASALARHDGIVADRVAAEGGHLIKSKGEGDSTFSVFSDPAAAVRAAEGIRAGVGAQDWGDAPLQVRQSVTTGVAELRDGDYFGPTVNRAARIRGLAAGGEILLSASTHDLLADSLLRGRAVEHRGEQELRGLTRPERIFALLDATGPDLVVGGGGLRERLGLLGGLAALAAVVALVVGAATLGSGGSSGSGLGDGGTTTTASTVPPPTVDISALQVASRPTPGTIRYEAEGRASNVSTPPYEIRLLARDVDEAQAWWWSAPITALADGTWAGAIDIPWGLDEPPSFRLVAVAILPPVGSEEFAIGDLPLSGAATVMEAELGEVGPEAIGVEAMSHEMEMDEHDPEGEEPPDPADFPDVPPPTAAS